MVCGWARKYKTNVGGREGGREGREGGEGIEKKIKITRGIDTQGNKYIYIYVIVAGLVTAK